MKVPAVPHGVIDFGLATFRRFVTMEGAQHATVLSAQAFTSLVPFLVVAAVVVPGDADLADRIIDRFDLDGASATSVKQLFASSTEVASTVTWVSVVILILATLSFSRAMQRMFQRAYGEEPQGPADIWRCLAWLAGFAFWITIASPLRQSIESVGGLVLTTTAATATGFVLWLWTPFILLGTKDWGRLVPGAAISGLLGALIGIASSVYLPIVMDWSARRYGLIGIAFSLQSWLLVFSFAIVIAAVVGALVTERLGTPGWVRTGPGPGPSG